jgi:hypothetical protein
VSDGSNFILREVIDGKKKKRFRNGCVNESERGVSGWVLSLHKEFIKRLTSHNAIRMNRKWRKSRRRLLIKMNI